MQAWSCLSLWAGLSTPDTVLPDTEAGTGCTSLAFRSQQRGHGRSDGSAPPSSGSRGGSPQTGHGSLQLPKTSRGSPSVTTTAFPVLLAPGLAAVC